MTRKHPKWVRYASLVSLLAVFSGCCRWRSQAIPDRYPLGSIPRAHFHAMQTNAEAADFIIHRNDFIGDTTELTPEGKDHVLEIAARMRSAPFPVIVERNENNSNPQLDAERRTSVALILGDLGNGDAEQRTFVSHAYGRGLRAVEGEFDYYRYVYSRGGFGGFNGGGGTFNQVGGFNGFGYGGYGFGR